ncbi:MAG: hypothetical protein J2P28_03920, partial [Actinobacteria bacterium]|nr:hypothetical protein [Actinomycetota bacterium]
MSEFDQAARRHTEAESGGIARRRVLQGLGIAAAPVAAGMLNIPQAFAAASSAAQTPAAGAAGSSVDGSTTTLSGRPRVMPGGAITEDIPIASYNVLDFGATPDGSADSTSAFQAALNAAAGDGGAVVFAPAGRYALQGNLSVPAAVTLRGQWRRPGSAGSGQGTVLMAYAGRDNAAGTAFLTTNHNCTIRDLTIWYPEQDDITDVHAYPWTIQDDQSQWYNGYYGGNILNVTLVNSYQGISFVVNDCHNIRNVYGTCL